MPPPSASFERTAVAVWVVAAVAVPLAMTWLAALVSLQPDAWAADARLAVAARVIAVSLVRGLVLSALTLAVAWPVSRFVPSVWLLASALVPVAGRAYGILAMGVPPGLLAYSVTHVTAAAPVAALLLQLRRRSLPAGSLEAARELGASPLQRWVWIELPHVAPAIGIATLWSLCQSLGDVVNGTIAGGGRIYGPGVMIRDAILVDAAPLRVALVTTALTLLAALVGTWIVRELLATRRSESEAGRPASTASLGSRGWIGAGLYFAMLAPLVGLATIATVPHDGRSIRALWDAAGATLVDATAAAVPAVAIALVLAVIVLERSVIGWGGMLLVPIVLPSALVGAVAASSARLVGVRPGLLLTTSGHLVHSVSLAFVFVLIAAASISPREAEAARDLGAAWQTRFRWLWIPALAPVAAVACVLAFSQIVFDASIPTFTAGPGGTTIAVVLATVARSGDVASLYAALLVVAGLPFVLAACLPRRSTR